MNALDGLLDTSNEGIRMLRSQILSMNAEIDLKLAQADNLEWSLKIAERVWIMPAAFRKHEPQSRIDIPALSNAEVPLWLAESQL